MGISTADCPTATPRLLLRRAAAAAACGKGTSTWDRISAAGLNPAPIRLGGNLLWSAEELAAWVRHGCPDRMSWTTIWQELARSSNQ